MALALGTKERRHQSGLVRGRVLPGRPALTVIHAWTDAHVPSRRGEMRVNETKLCTYSLSEPIDQGQVSLLQGEAYCVNRSRQGILLMMGDQPREGQLLEVHLREGLWRYSATVYEVRWASAVSIESQGELYLVGCRRVFCAAPYLKF